MWIKLKPYILSVLIALGTGALSAFLIRDNLNIYDSLNKPAFSPPAFLFPTVWTILYVLLGISSARIWLQRGSHSYEVMDSLLAYALQLILNFFWPIIFFNMQTFLFAFIWLVVLCASVLKMIFKFSVLDKNAAYLNIPYILWVTFAGYLNFMIYLLN